MYFGTFAPHDFGVPGIPQMPRDVCLPGDVGGYQGIWKRLGKGLAGENIESETVPDTFPPNQRSTRRIVGAGAVLDLFPPPAVEAAPDLFPPPVSELVPDLYPPRELEAVPDPVPPPPPISRTVPNPNGTRLRRNPLLQSDLRLRLGGRSKSDADM